MSISGNDQEEITLKRIDEAEGFVGIVTRKGTGQDAVYEASHFSDDLERNGVVGFLKVRHVVDLLVNKKVDVYTVIEKNGVYLKGSKVEVMITTDANNTEDDNLNNLPSF